MQLITDATVAQYIHEISARHRSRGPESIGRRGAHASSEAAATSRMSRRRLELVEDVLGVRSDEDWRSYGRPAPLETTTGDALCA
jgi:hypothetical protein